MPTVFKGLAWKGYMTVKGLSKKKIEEIYICSHKYNNIYKIGDYHFCFNIRRGYKNLTSLKRVITRWGV